ncbi:hypothetical protein NUH87_06085 [Pseudomonas batumici]|uniref:hypothetical protein n=1 Tax=Pseudomonas batumici TaxID=226910 RepID=UPI0030D193A9
MLFRSVDILIGFNFMASMLVVIFGTLSAIYVFVLYVGEKRDKDLSHYLFSRRHRLVLRCFNLPGAKVAIITASLCALIILSLLLLDIHQQLKFGAGLKSIAWHSYLSIWIVIGPAILGVVVQVGSGDKGMVLPIGNKLALSVDKGNSLAIHLSEEKPNIKNVIAILPPVVKDLRARGIKDPLVFKSWLFVSQLDRNDKSVKQIRVYFKRVQWLSRLIDCLPWSAPSKESVLRKFFTLVIPTATAPLYALVFWMPMKRCLTKLPGAKLRGKAQLLMANLKDQTGGRIELILPRPVSPAMVVSLGVKLPAIANSFGGKHGGFILHVD